MRSFKVLLVLFLLIASPSVRAGQLEIMSFTPEKEELVFRTSDSGTVHHSYRLEASTSLVASAWSVKLTVGGIGPTENVANPIPTNSPSMFYRVVATSNSAVFVDGAYMSINISGGTTATTYPVTYYRSLAEVPGGADSDTYKTTNILMRLIPKGTFVMGSPSFEIGRYSEETQHRVTLTKDFYIGVFEVTQRQWELVMDDRPSSFNNDAFYATRPVEQVSYDYNIRGCVDPNVEWPTSSLVLADSFMGRLRAKTGLFTFDLPTEAQWEYACRAGTATALNTGYNLTLTSGDPRMDAAGRYWYNGGSGYTQNCDTSVATAKVGSYLPNAWGLYDMHGNVAEWCLDWHGVYPGAVIDPFGAASGSSRVVRGMSWYTSAIGCRSAIRGYSYPLNLYGIIGFRAAMTLP